MTRIATTALVLAALAGAAAGQSEPPPRLSVTGIGSAAAAPDIAVIDFGVAARGADAGEAFAAVSAAMGAVFDAAAAAGIAPSDLRTIEIALDPVYAPAREAVVPRIEAFEARQRVAATVRDLDALGPLIAAAAQAGANLVGGVSFDLADRAPLEDAARRAAVQDAMRTARLLAEAAGVTLGAPVSIALQGGPGPRPMMRAAAMDAAAPVAPGDLSVSAAVSVVFAIE